MNLYSFRALNVKNEKIHLSALETPLGTRSIAQSVSYCNRCGLCLQRCPFYLQTQEEPLGPRGKNQVARLLLERKLTLAPNRKELLRLSNLCSLCGRCTNACPGQIPTPQHVLELRRLLGVSLVPNSLKRLLQCRADNPTLFTKIARIGLILRKLGVVKLLRFSGLANLLGLSWLHQADRMIPPAARKDRKQWLTRLRKQEDTPSLIYIPSMETELFLPQVCTSVWNLAAKKYHPVVWAHTSTGLFEYVYGNVRKARKQLNTLITRHAHTRNGKLPVLTDSLDVYNFLKQAATLFEEYPHKKEQALQFSKRVLFVTDLPFGAKALDFPTPLALDTSALFSQEKEPLLKAEKRMHTLFGKNFVHCNDRQADMPAFGYSFIEHNKASLLRDLSLRPLLEKEVKTVVVLSSWALLEVYAARKRAPSLQAIHIAQVNG